MLCLPPRMFAYALQACAHSYRHVQDGSRPGRARQTGATEGGGVQLRALPHK